MAEWNCLEQQKNMLCYKRVGSHAIVMAVADRPITPQEALRAISPDLTMAYGMGDVAVIMEAKKYSVGDENEEKGLQIPVGHYGLVSPWWKFWKREYAIRMEFPVEQWRNKPGDKYGKWVFKMKSPGVTSCAGFGPNTDCTITEKKK